MFLLSTRARPVYTRGMASIASRLSANRVPVTDGRSAEARFLRRIRADLSLQCGGKPTAIQYLLIDRIAQLSLRIHALDHDPLSGYSTREYLDATATLGQLLTQLGVQAVTPTNMRRPFCEAAA
jgi:hypothetical protein